MREYDECINMVVLCCLEEQPLFMCMTKSLNLVKIKKFRSHKYGFGLIRTRLVLRILNAIHVIWLLENIEKTFGVELNLGTHLTSIFSILSS